MPEEERKMDKRKALKVVDMKLEQFLVNKWYGKIIIDIEAGKPIWIKAQPEIRERVG